MGTMKIKPKNIPIGTYFILFLDKFSNLDSSIIIANKNKIAIAPTYTIIKSNAKSSHSNKKSNKVESTKLIIKNKSCY